MAASPGKVTGTLAATGASDELGPCKAVHISITGTWAGTVKAQRSLDGTNWVDLPNASWTANVETQFQIGVRPIIFRLDWTRVSGSLVYTVEADDGESAAVARPVSPSDPVAVQGNVASAATDSGNPVKVGGVVQIGTLPVYTDGQRADLNQAANGALLVNATIYGAASGADGRTIVDLLNRASVSDASSGFPLTTAKFAFNGTNWDRWRNNGEGTLLASAARTATTNSTDQVNYNWRGVHVIIDITAGSGLTITPSITGKDPISGTYYTLLAGTALTGTGITILKVYPGITAAANASASDILPRTWRFTMTAGDATSATYSVAYVGIL